MTTMAPTSWISFLTRLSINFHDVLRMLSQRLCALTYLQCFALKLVNDASDFSQQEGPGVDEVNPVHHDSDDAVPALETSSQAVFDKEGVAEHKTVLFISEKNRALTSWADLKRRDTDTLKHITQGNKANRASCSSTRTW